jgi:hypothetical protein
MRRQLRARLRPHLRGPTQQQADPGCQDCRQGSHAASHHAGILLPGPAVEQVPLRVKAWRPRVQFACQGPLDSTEPAPGLLTMLMASKGQRQAQWWQPVHPAGSASCARLSHPLRSSTSTWGAHAATQRPHPVQRWGSIWGRCRGKAGPICQNSMRSRSCCTFRSFTAQPTKPGAV